ncbi:MAG: trimethylamine methyltransferase family protein [Eubacterium sp.]|jgi:trimethylamine--corrinoid protein Co-methyltransferase|nr:trimethylamine methyltransferase family protein [Eubacterium sp.]
MKSAQQLIHEASVRILGRTGMYFQHPKAQQVLRDHGIDVDDGGVARFTEDQLMYWVSKAPHAFTMFARNPKHNIFVGGDVLNPAPGYGCPFIVDMEGKKRQAVTADYIKFTKLYHEQESFHVNGGITVQPSDLPVSNATLLMYYMAYLYSDKTMLTGTADSAQVDAMMRMAAAQFGGKEEMKKYPRLITLINTVCPLQMTNVMTESLFKFCEYGQPVIIGSLGQAGSTAPVTLAGTMAISNAECLAGIALTEMINPGNPVVYGWETTTSDMRSGATAIGSPEGAICYKFSGLMSQFYGIPNRSGGCLTDAKKVDAQAGYESMITFNACREGNCNFMIHAAGIMDAYASMSYEKLIVDFEVIDYVNRVHRDFEINEDTLPEDLIDEVGHGGVYLTEDHTFEFCRVEPLTPSISVRGTTSNPGTQLEDNIRNKIDRMLKNYKRPEIDPAVLDQMHAILKERGVDEELIRKIDEDAF